MTPVVMRTGHRPRTGWAVAAVLPPLLALGLWLAMPELARRLPPGGWSALALLWSLLLVTGVLRQAARASCGQPAPAPAPAAASAVTASAEPPQTRWLRSATHELRNRLAALGGAVEVLHMGNVDAAVQGRARSIVAEQARALERLADHLDALLAEGRQRPHQPCDLAALARAALDAERPGAQRAGRMLLHDLRPAPVRGDALALEQAIGCLVRQQLRQLPLGGAAVLSVGSEGERAWLRLRSTGDDGAEPREHGAAAAQAYDTAIDPDLGNTLAQATIERHGGALQAIGEQPAQGVHAWLPLLRQPLHTSAAAATPRRIVLVEDIESVRQTLAATLEREGHEVDSAPDGVQGLRRLLQLWPDAAVVDLSLPGLSGLELARHARRHGFTGRMVAVAGYGSPHEPGEALRCGFDAWLTKPVSLHELRQALQPDQSGAAPGTLGARTPADQCNQFSGSSHGLDPHRR